MLTKVIDGTTESHSGNGLCTSCRFGMVVKGDSSRQVLTRCNRFERNMTFQVRECSEFESKATPSLWDMKEIALRLVVDKTGKIGFLPGKKFDEAVSEGKASDDAF